MHRLFASMALILLLQGCANSVGLQQHQAFSLQGLQAGKVLFVEPDVTVKELGVGMAEEVPEWTAEGRENLTTELRQHLQEQAELEFIELADLSTEHIQQLEEHTALYKLVATQHLLLQGPNDMGWKRIQPLNQYSIGPGLRFLEADSGPQFAIMTVGEDLISSGGRVATQIALAMLGVAAPGGYCVVHSGIVDLASGDVLWTNTTVSGTHSLRSKENTREMVAKLFDGMGQTKGDKE